MPKEIPKTYNSQKVEDALYKQWESSGLFRPASAKATAGLRPFSISMPPPNATGTLHLGHAAMLALQDIMTRYARMNGRPTLWVPGVDHASIATENKVEKLIKDTQNKTKQQLGRDEFLTEVNKFVAESKSTIENQVRKMGSSCDWSRERYTLDAGLSRCVQEVFVKMHNDGLIYRGHRIVNWCTRCQSTLADDEVEYKEQYAPLYTFTYDKNFPIPIATTRPETKLGDTAVAVHPADKRYKKYVGKTIAANFLGTPLELKIIADTSINPEFGTGALGVTPAHSLADAELARTHALKTISVIDEHGKITEGISKFSGQYNTQARESIATELKRQDLLTEQKEIVHNLSVCYRCGTPIEPLVSEQWFVDVNKKIPARKKSLKELAITAVKSGDIEIIPDRFNKTYFQWMENLHDWCISRQIWFGHRIPVYYCKQGISKFEIRNSKLKCRNPIVSAKPIKKCPHCGGLIKQDQDTLDTWFSSALWTFSTLLDKPKKDDTLDSWIARNRKKGTDMATFHPTSVMETGYDILFFWVARMILMTTYTLGEAPFKTVYLHGLVRDKLGRKMSKSLDNGIDPIDMINKYGADATRLSLVIGTTPGNDTRIYEEKIAGYRNFVNKIWNIARFVLTNESARHPERSDERRRGAKSKDDGITHAASPTHDGILSGAESTLADQWIALKLSQLIAEVDAHFETYEFSIAGEKIYDFLWHDLADWYLEIAKTQEANIAPHILLEALKLLHPFTPFVTEEIYQRIKQSGLVEANHAFLATSQWPSADFVKTQNLASLSSVDNKKVLKNFQSLQSLITTLRDLRAAHNLPYSEKLDAAIATKKHKDLFQEMEVAIEQMTKIRIQVLPTKPTNENDFIRSHTADFDVYIKIGAQQKREQEIRLAKEQENLKTYITTLEKKLANKQFTDNAPKKVVKQEQQKLKDAQNKLKKI